MFSRRLLNLSANAPVREIGLFMAFFVLNSLNSWQYLNTWDLLSRELTYFCVMYAYALLHRFGLLPLLLTEHRPLRYASLVALTLPPYAYLIMRLDLWIYAAEYTKRPIEGPVYLFNMACLIANTLLFSLPTLIQQFYRQRQQEDEYQILRQQVELNNLRSQLNPHFLFNTLNNLYGLSLRQPHRAPDLIMQLAGLMRYQLDSASQTLVPLKTELEALENYIGLETERVGSRCDVTYTGPNQIPDYPTIAPMLLLPYVENAFKHGTAGAEACRVSVWVQVSDGKVRLRVQNTVPSRAKAPVSTGVGLVNTRQRLTMLYPNRHYLLIESLTNQYSVDLTISLTEVHTHRQPIHA